MPGPCLVRHRVNTRRELAAVPREEGVEIDVRSDRATPGRLVLAHDPWRADAEDLAPWLDAFAARGMEGPLIVNTKEDGLEGALFDALGARGVTDFFLLDTTLPSLVAWSQARGERRFALRVSAYEPPEAARAFAGHVEWAWLDCFGGHPLDAEVARALAPYFRLCLVSPELQGADPGDLRRFAGLAPLADAICTKRPEAWRRAFPEIWRP